jgi:hypothetical protein
MEHALSGNDCTKIEIKILPGSSRNRVTLEENGSLKVHLTAPPVDGKANRALIAFLSSILSVPKKAITLVKGETSRKKVIEITGMTKNEIRSKVGEKS